MKVCVLDTETTGLEYEKGHKFVEVGLLTYDLETGRLLDRYVQRVDPERSIDPGAQAAHGITYAELVGQPKWEDIAADVKSRLESADLLVAHNMGFDGPFIAHELLQAGLQVPETPSICTMTGARWATPDGKLPRLGELCFALGVDYDPAKAHAAEYDILCTAACFFKGLERGFYELPKELRKMAEMSSSSVAEPTF